MKGIDPLIAAVILIAFVIAVAGIVGVFFTSFTRTTTAGIEQQTKGAVACSGVYIDVISYNSSNGNLVVRNPSNTRIYVTSIVNTAGSVNNSLNLALAAGGVSSVSTGVTSSNTAGSKITLTGFCESAGTNSSIVGECSFGQSCWQ